jgi:DNA-binding response OmpR family regulator
MILRQNGFDVHLAADGEQALELVRQYPAAFNLILMDVRMPNLDGPQTLARMQEHDPEVRCCFMSGGTGTYTQEDLLGQGALCLIRKPFVLADLLAQLHRWTGQATHRECC